MLVPFKTYYESHFLGLILLNGPRVTFGLRLSFFAFLIVGRRIQMPLAW